MLAMVLIFQFLNDLFIGLSLHYEFADCHLFSFTDIVFISHNFFRTFYF